MKHRILKSCVSMLLVVCMIMGLMATAYAADNSSKEIVYVSFGDSTSNGYGMNSIVDEEGKTATTYWGLDSNGNPSEDKNVYGWGRKVTWSYPTLISNAFTNAGFTVDYRPMATSNFRAEELHAMLVENDQVYNSDAYGRSVFWGQGDWFDKIISRTGIDSSGGYADTMRKQFQTAVKDADVISIDLGMNNFGTYVTGRLMKRQELMSGGTTDQAAIEAALPARNTFDEEDDAVLIAAGEQLGEQLLEEILIGLGFTAPATETFQSTLLQMQSAAAANSEAAQAYAQLYALKVLVEGLVDDTVYGYMGFIKNMDGALKQIGILNPDANVIVIGVYNSMVGVELEISALSAITGQNNARVELGNIWENVMAAANDYTKNYLTPDNANKFSVGTDENVQESCIPVSELPETLNYRYVDPVAEGTRVELFFDQLVGSFYAHANEHSESYTDISIDPAYEDYEIGINMYALLLPMVQSAVAANQELINTANGVIEQMANGNDIVIDTGINFMGSTVEVTVAKSDVTAALNNAISEGTTQSVNKVVAPTMGAILRDPVIDLGALLSGSWTAESVEGNLVQDLTGPIANLIIELFIDKLTAVALNNDTVKAGITFGAVTEDGVREIVSDTIYDKLGDDAPEYHLPASTLSAEDKSILSLYLRFLYGNGLMVHPDEVGYQQMANAVLDELSFVSGISASETALNREGGNVTVTVNGYGLADGLTVSAVCGETVISGVTSGNGTEQTVELTLPANEGSETLTYTVSCGNQSVSVDITTTETVPEEMSVAFKSLTLTLEGNLAIDFYAQVDEQGYESGYDVGALIWFKNYGSAENPVMDVNSKTNSTKDDFDNNNAADPYRRTAEYVGIDGDGQHRISVGNIAAKEMGDKVYIIPYIVTADGETIYGAQKAFSVYDVANLVLNSDDEKFIRLANALIAYGEAAETYFAKN